jgi:class 3 adenylate cyclase/DNA polymerase III delta prime subunit
MAEVAGQIGTRSVLFTDLVGSTELRVRLGEEAADTLRRAHNALLVEAVTAHGGTVVKGLGDGIMVTFESAADAVSAAVAVQQAADGHSRRVPAEAFSVRVGLSIGDVSTEEGDVFGVPVVEASRLCSVAAGGEILAAELVRALTRGRGGFVFEPMGDLDLKGLPEPVSACRVYWEPLLEAPTGDARAVVPIAPALLGTMATTYVGREPLRDRLADEWSAARAGACRTLLLAGEPGVGKTRTAAEVARAAFTEGAVVLFGRCDEDLGVPYQPFVEALEHYVTHAGAPVLGRLAGELRRLVPDLGAGIGTLEQPVPSDPASEEHRLFEACASWLIDAARAADAGLMLVLDDIHWATKPTLQLMQHVVRSACDEGAPLLVLATYRDTDIDRAHPLAASIGDLRRLPGVDRVAVDNLSSAEVKAFIAAAAGHDLDEATRHLADVVYAETEGNPFFVGEVLRHLVETGGVRREGERWVVADPDHVAIPEGVRDVVGRRLNRLSAAANDVLSVAAVIGRDFDMTALVAVAGVTDDDALDALDAAVRARLVEEIEVDRYRFGHALVRTTLYDELSATRRRRLHRRVADVLEKLRPDDVRALAYHCTEGGPDGGDMTRAVRYTLAAAEESLAARAFADAEARFRSALELLEDAEDVATPAWVAALCGLGEAQRDQGDPGFRETLLDASARAIELNHIDLVVRAVLSNTRGFASIVGGIDVERLEVIDRALELVGTAVSPNRAKLLGQLASELTFSGHHERRLALADEAVAMARTFGDDVLLGNVLVTTGYACNSSHRWQELIDRSAEATRLADANGDPAKRVVARVFFSSALLTAGRLDESNSVTRDMIAIAEAEGSPLIRWIALSNYTRLPALAGDLDQAEVSNNHALTLAQELDQHDGEMWWAAALVGLAWLRGSVGAYADAAADFAEQFPLAKVWRCAQAWLLAEAGRHDEARAVIRDFALDPVALIVEPWPFTAATQLAFAAFHLDDAELGAKVIESIADHPTCWSHYYLMVFGPLTWTMGLATAATGAYDESVASFESTLVTLVEHNLVAFIPTLRLHLADVLRRRAAPGDAERAAVLLATARDEAVAIGAAGVVEKVDALAPFAL